MITYNHRIHSPYLFRPLRTEEEARREMEKQNQTKSD